jgi:adenylate kinase
MIIAITGTPGTGKTTIAKLLKKEYLLDVINIHDFSKEANIIDGFDEKRQSDIINVKKLDEKIKKYTENKSILVLDGHLSHLLTCVSFVILLRCNPLILQNRLKSKQWRKVKIQENIQAEILDIIKIESMNLHSKDNIIEIDTSETSEKDIADLIYMLIKTNFSDKNKFNSNSIDWSEYILSNDISWRMDNNGT